MSAEIFIAEFTFETYLNKKAAKDTFLEVIKRLRLFGDPIIDSYKSELLEP